MELENKVAVVTGGSEGLGLSVVKSLLKEKVIVHVFSKDLAKQNSMKEEISDINLHTHSLDITDYSAIATEVESIGDIDILINNAGIWLEGGLEDCDEEDISRTIDVNTKGVIYCTKALLPSMLKNNSGYIMNVSSTSGIKGRAGQSVYCASKWAVTGFTEALKDDLKGTDIKVVGFYPGGMNTKLFEKSGFPKEIDDWMDTDKVAEIITFMLKLDDTMLIDHLVLNKRNTKTSN
jgi:3-oxoacyl-[acyl-carrier protein] reductase